MAGAPNPSGKGKIPGLTPAQLDWSATDIAYYLETGFTPDFDSAGSGMASVVENLSNLPSEDREAIAANETVQAITQRIGRRTDRAALEKRLHIGSEIGSRGVTPLRLLA